MTCPTCLSRLRDLLDDASLPNSERERIAREIEAMEMARKISDAASIAGYIEGTIGRPAFFAGYKAALSVLTEDTHGK